MYNDNTKGKKVKKKKMILDIFFGGGMFGNFLFFRLNIISFRLVVRGREERGGRGGRERKTERERLTEQEKKRERKGSRAQN